MLTTDTQKHYHTFISNSSRIFFAKSQSSHLSTLEQTLETKQRLTKLMKKFVRTFVCSRRKQIEFEKKCTKEAKWNIYSLPGADEEVLGGGAKYLLGGNCLLPPPPPPHPPKKTSLKFTVLITTSLVPRLHPLSALQN